MPIQYSIIQRQWIVDNIDPENSQDCKEYILAYIDKNTFIETLSTVLSELYPKNPSLFNTGSIYFINDEFFAIKLVPGVTETLLKNQHWQYNQHPSELVKLMQIIAKIRLVKAVYESGDEDLHAYFEAPSADGIWKEVSLSDLINPNIIINEENKQMKKNGSTNPTSALSRPLSHQEILTKLNETLPPNCMKALTRQLQEIENAFATNNPEPQAPYPLVFPPVSISDEESSLLTICPSN